MRKFVLINLLAVLVASISAYQANAQIREEPSLNNSATAQQVTKFRYTFLWDVTTSMYGKKIDGSKADVSKDIYDEVQNNLIKQINKIDDETAEIVVIPFQAGVIYDYLEKECNDNRQEWKCKSATSENKSKLIKKIKDNKGVFPEIAKKRGGGTDILSSLQWTTENIFDKTRTDILFLLTDGSQEGEKVIKRSGGKDALEKYINSDWKNFALSRNVQGFYLVLTEEANNGAPNIDNDVPMKLIPALDLEFPSPINIQLESPLPIDVKNNEVFEQAEFRVFKVSYQINGGRLPEGSRLKIRMCDNDYIAVDKNIVDFSNRQLEIPYHFLKNHDTTVSELPEKCNVYIYVDEFICNSETAKNLTTVSPRQIPVTIINKSQPAIEIYWEY